MPSPTEIEQLVDLHNAGRYAELEGRANSLLTRSPEFGLGWKLLGSALQMQGKNALLAFRKAAELMPDEAEAHCNLAAAQKSFGLLNDAAASYRRALQIDPEYADAYFCLGNTLTELGQLDDAISNYHRALQIKPDFAEAYLKLADVLSDLGQLNDAVSSYRRTLELKPEYADAYYCLGNTLTELGQLDEAISNYRRALQIEPDFAAAHNRLGVALEAFGQFDEARASYRRTLELRPDLADAHNNLGRLFLQLGQFDAAVTSFRAATGLKPDFAEAHDNLGNALQSLGLHDEARASFKRAVQLKHNLAVAHNDLGVALLERGQSNSALAKFRRALDLKPDFARAHGNLGLALLRREQFADAASSFRRALQLNPGSAEAHFNLGNALRNLGQNEDALASYRRALELKPDFVAAQSTLLFTLNYISSRPESSLDEARKYGRMVDKKVTSRFTSWLCTAKPECLRVGIVSGDLYKHPVAYFLEALLAHNDPACIELIAYSASSRVDDFTARISRNLAALKPIHGLSDEAAARLIHSDGVHILIDLSGHTANNRLPVFAWKPAPVQVSWLGYFATTGVKEMDYLLADEVGVPEAQREHFTESVWYLPDTRLCFTAPGIDLPVAPLPALARGFITFGCFQNMAKLGDDVLEAWGKILAALPNARLRLQTYQLDKTSQVEQLVQRLQRHGIDPARVALHGSARRDAYLAAHAEVDMILDTFPYPGGTTTCEALWMGVPTLTLAGDSLLARQGASLLSAAGLEEWVATSKAEYTAKAIRFAVDKSGLALLRAGLRQKVLASPLFDAPSFARHFEDAMRGMWQATGQIRLEG